MKKIWITGSAGMLASHFQRILQQKNVLFVANDRNTIDITQLDAVSDFVRHEKITHSINCAAYTQVDHAETEQKQAYLVNAVGPHNLGIAARKHGARVLHFSTDYVFDGNARKPYSENHLCSPIGSYGLSKLAGEMKLLEEHHHSCIIRTSWLFGSPGKNFVSTMLRLMREREEISVVYDQTGRPAYCEDLAQAALEILDEEGIFHFANSFETSWFQFAKEIHRQAKELDFPLLTKSIVPITTRDFPTPAKRPPYSTLNTQKVEATLGKKIRPWQEALNDYLLLFKSTQLVTC